MENKRRLYFILTLLWMGVIFYMSSQSGQDSADLSSSITHFILSLVYAPYRQLSPEHQLEIVMTFGFLVRKCAHMTEYAILAFISSQYVKTFDQVKHPYLYSLLFCFLYACSDEFHQCFSDQRGPSMMDVGIDSIGACISLGLQSFLMKIKK